MQVLSKMASLIAGGNLSESEAGQHVIMMMYIPLCPSSCWGGFVPSSMSKTTLEHLSFSFVQFIPLAIKYHENNHNHAEKFFCKGDEDDVDQDDDDHNEPPGQRC